MISHNDAVDKAEQKYRDSVDKMLEPLTETMQAWLKQYAQETFDAQQVKNSEKINQE
jgi:hypothetical protein